MTKKRSAKNKPQGLDPGPLPVIFTQRCEKHGKTIYPKESDALARVGESVINAALHGGDRLYHYWCKWSKSYHVSRMDFSHYPAGKVL